MRIAAVHIEEQTDVMEVDPSHGQRLRHHLALCNPLCGSPPYRPRSSGQGLHTLLTGAPGQLASASVTLTDRMSDHAAPATKLESPHR